MSGQEMNNVKASKVIQLLLSSAHFIQQEYEAQLAVSDCPFPISRPRMRLMLAVWSAGTIRMNELATQLGVKARTITEQVDALERDGLMQRIADPHDRRATLLRLTEAAEAHVHWIKANQENISEALLQSFSYEQRAEIYRLLQLFFDGKDIKWMC